MTDTLIHGKFEFNGFRYEIHEDEENNVYALPWRDRIDYPQNSIRYLTAAVRAFEDEYNWSKRK